MLYRNFNFFFLVWVLLTSLTACQEEEYILPEPISQLTNDCLKRTIGLSIASLPIEFAYAMAIPNHKVSQYRHRLKPQFLEELAPIQSTGPIIPIQGVSISLLRLDHVLRQLTLANHRKLLSLLIPTRQHLDITTLYLMKQKVKRFPLLFQ